MRRKIRALRDLGGIRRDVNGEGIPIVLLE